MIITDIRGLKSIVPSFPFDCVPVFQDSPLQRSVLQSVVNRLILDLQKVEMRIAWKLDRGDVLFTLTRMNQERKTLAATEIMAKAALIVIARTETGSTLLCAVVHPLTQNSVA